MSIERVVVFRETWCETEEDSVASERLVLMQGILCASGVKHCVQKHQFRDPDSGQSCGLLPRIEKIPLFGDQRLASIAHRVGRTEQTRQMPERRPPVEHKSWRQFVST